MTNKQLTYTQSKRLIKGVVVILVALLCWYVVSRFIRVISGPSLVTFTATSLDSDYPALMQIQGVTKNTETLFINEYPVVPAVDGGFNYTFVAPPGYSLMKFTAYDKFNNTVTETLALHVDEPPDAITITSQPKPTVDTDVESEESQQETNNL